MELLHGRRDLVELGIAAGAEGLPVLARVQWAAELADQTTALAKKVRAAVDHIASSGGGRVVATPGAVGKSVAVGRNGSPQAVPAVVGLCHSFEMRSGHPSLL